MAAYIVTPEAAADLLQIWLYIAQDSEETAERVEAEFYETFESLSRMPAQGYRRPDYTKTKVLFFPLYSYLIIYRPETDPMQILGIVHGARRVKTILRQRGIH